MRKPTKMAIYLAKKIWPIEMLRNGIIEPRRAIKDDIIVLDGERLALLKSKFQITEIIV